MNQRASVIMEGNFNEYTLKELLEVASLCRQLIEVSLSRGSELQGQLLLKAGQLLEAKLISSAQQGVQAFQSLLDSSFDQFRVVQLKRQPWTRDPIGRLIDLMNPSRSSMSSAPSPMTDSAPSVSSAPAAPSAPSAPAVAVPSAPSALAVAASSAPSAPAVAEPSVPAASSAPSPAAPTTHERTLVAPAPRESTISAPAPTKSVTQAPTNNVNSTPLSPPRLSSARPSTPALLSKPLSATSLPKPPALSNTPAPDLSALDDQSATSVFSSAEVSELITLINVIEQQRATLGAIESECKQLGQYAQQLYAQLQRQGEQLTHQSSRGEQLASHQSSILQQLHEAARHLNETQQAQSVSVRQLLGYAQQSQGALEVLRQSMQTLETQRSERPENTSGQQAPDLMGGSVGSQLLLELARGQGDKESTHLTPLMVVSLFIQVISLILVSVLVVKMLF